MPYYREGTLAWFVLEALRDKGHLTVVELEEAIGKKWVKSTAQKLRKKGLINVYHAGVNDHFRVFVRYRINEVGMKVLSGTNPPRDAPRIGRPPNLFPGYGSLRYRVLARMSADPKTISEVSSTKDFLDDSTESVREAIAHCVKRGWVAKTKSFPPHEYTITLEGETALDLSWEAYHASQMD